MSQGEPLVYTGVTWLDYVAAKERLSLARAAINFIVSGGRKVPQDLRNLCLEAGLCTMETYTAMFLAGEVTFNRIHFHVLFSASVSCIYSIIVDCDASIGLDVEDLDLSQADFRTRAFGGLELSVRVLSDMANSLQDLKEYSAALSVVVSQIRGPPGTSPLDPSLEHFLSGSETAYSSAADYHMGMNQGQHEGIAAPPFMSTSDWQSIGTEMWHFVEPHWPDLATEGHVLNPSDEAMGSHDWNTEEHPLFNTFQ